MSTSAPASDYVSPAPATLHQDRLSAMYEAARAQFAWFKPELNNPAFMENAGGSQVPCVVADAVRHHMLYDNAQLGAGYGASDRATSKVALAHAVMETFMGAERPGSVVLGSSTTLLLHLIGNAYSRMLQPRDEIVVQLACHEANIGPWVRAAARSGAKIVWWRGSSNTRSSASASTNSSSAASSESSNSSCSPADCGIESLLPLLSAATRIVALTHVSNLLGQVLDVAAAVAAVRAAAPRARIVVDGVAYAPHRAVDVGAWGVDWYALSCYKVWGPHMAALYGSTAAFQEMAEAGAGEAPNHYWIADTDIPYKWEVGGVSHEGCAGIVAMAQYLQVLSKLWDDSQSETHNGTCDEGNVPPPLSRSTLLSAYSAIAAMEAPLTQLLLSFLASHPRVHVMGSDVAGEARVPTISFAHSSKAPSAIVKAVQAQGFAIRHGHMYARRLVEALLPSVIAPLQVAHGSAKSAEAAASAIDEGVVRISLLHYNTPEEVEGLICALDTIL